MNNYQHEAATEFERYQSLTTDMEREAFWHDVAKRSEAMPNDQRLQFQQAIRGQINQMLHRMESVAQLLALPQKSIAE